MLKNLNAGKWLVPLLVVGAIALFAFRGCSGVIPKTNSGSTGQTSGQAGDMGNMYVASQIDQDGCPVREETRFAAGDAVYVGTEPSNIPQGTAVFARLIYEGQPVEDTDEIVADQDLRGTCAWFEFEAARGSRGLEPGSYQAELIVNGNRVDRVQFEVEDGFGSQGSGARVDLGQFMATSRVDSDGCPTDSADVYRPDDPIVVALEESLLPRGTEVYARLLYEGETVETAQPIVADRDIQSCVWFQFDANTTRGFDPGRYEAQIFVDGSRSDSVDFIVQ